MTEPPIADDFAAIAKRLREIEGEEPQPGGWGLWYTQVQPHCWLNNRGKSLVVSSPVFPPSTWPTEDLARQTLEDLRSECGTAYKYISVREYP